jgi:archaellum biogenesis protein FlaJ (TadC family)
MSTSTLLFADSWLAWLEANGAVLWWTFALSLVGFFGSIVVVVILLVKIPADYFAHPAEPWSTRSLASHVWLVLKNALGVVVVLAGIAMLFLPGQGILTILIGIMLLNFPGKRRLEIALVHRPGVLNAINRLRARYGKPPLVFEVERDSSRSEQRTE